MIRFIFGTTNITVLLCTKLKLNKKQKLEILKEIHDSKLIGGHSGKERTIIKLKRLGYFWEGITQAV